MSEWISVEDRLPEHGKSVVIYLANQVLTGWYSESSFDWYTDFDENEEYPISVTYWMPLPEPPPLEESV